MTEKSNLAAAHAAVLEQQSSGKKPAGFRSFSTVSDPGIVVDMEIQPGDPVDSQIIRNFMGEFEAATKKRNSSF